jgi:hypothetical protein
MASRTRKLLTKDEIGEMWSLFGPPPVLSTEDRQSYDRICAEYVVLYKPTNLAQLKAIRDVVDADWEIFRFRRHRSLGIERHFRKFLDDQVLRIRFHQEKSKQRVKSGRPSDLADLAELQRVVENTQSDVEDILNRPATEIDHNLAFEQGAEFFDHLDKWLNSATARRNAALQILEYCCERLSDEDETIDIEYQEVETRKIEHTNSPLLAPTEVIASDIAAQNSSKPAELPKE